MLHCAFKYLILVNLVVSSAWAQNEGKIFIEDIACVRTHDNSSGTCKYSNNCPAADEESKRGIPLTICGAVGRKTIVCCPQKRISYRKCEEYTELAKDDSTCNQIMSRIFVKRTAKSEFPHMVAIGWNSSYGTISFNCGGSLISDRFVLNAAHCGLLGGDSPSIVRLGVKTLNNRNDGTVELDVAIAEFIPHEKFKFNSLYYDIALIRMNESVTFTEHIRPACLWQSSDFSQSMVIETVWESTLQLNHTLDELTKHKMNVIDKESCNNLVKLRKLNQGILDSQICAGSQGGDRDTCSGNSGGPIQITTSNNFCLYHVVGVASFGSLECSRRNIPDIFTRVSFFLEWIEDKVWG